MKKIQFLICAMCVVTLNAYATTFWANNAQHATTSCDGNDVTVPSTNPTPPTGYQFAGWAPAYDMSTVNISENSSTLSGSRNQPEWSATFSYGTVKGTTLCSTNTGNTGAIGNPVEDQGSSIWCLMTALSDGVTDFIPVVSYWIYIGAFSSAGDCINRGAESCAWHVANTYTVRLHMYGGN